MYKHIIVYLFFSLIPFHNVNTNPSTNRKIYKYMEKMEYFIDKYMVSKILEIVLKLQGAINVDKLIKKVPLLNFHI